MNTNSLSRLGFLALLLAALVVPAVAAPGQTTLPLCFGKSATIVGDADDGFIRGTNGDDVILVRHTDAFVKGKGADRICGGQLSDDLSGGRGPDRIEGGATTLSRAATGRTTCPGVRVTTSCREARVMTTSTAALAMTSAPATRASTRPPT